MKKVWLLDAGHGGINSDGKYTTDLDFDPSKKGAGTKCYSFGGKKYIYEGEYNRKIQQALIKLIVADGDMEWFIINDKIEDTPLSKRCDRANEYQAIHKRCVFVSNHGNGGKGTGIEGFTTIGPTKSDPICTVFLNQAAKSFPEKVLRTDSSDGDPDKEAMFYVLKHTSCPAILMEFFFMDREEDYTFMLTDECIQRVAESMFNAMKVVDVHPEL